MKLEIGNTVFQEGRPKIAVSLTGTTPQEIIKQCEEAVTQPVDVIEWRADYYFSKIEDMNSKLMQKELYIEIIKILDDINFVAQGRPIIFTIRSTKQGGLGTMTSDQEESVQRFVTETGFVDFIDIEVTGPNAEFGGIEGQELEDRVKMIHGKGCHVILSYHDFDGMPKAEDVVRIATKMWKAEGDLCKIAAMALAKEDAMAMLKATAYLTKKEIGPVITMAMGSEGILTRIVGGKYGSVVTFASVGAPSAPGQISAAMMKKKLDEFYGEE